MLIIEGPDMLGKTTFARKLVEALDCVHIDKFGLPEVSYTTPGEWLARYDVNAIADRYVISEPLYGLICRNKANMSVQAFLDVWYGLQDRGGYHVLVFYADPADYDKILEQRYDPAREAFSKDQCRLVNKAYFDLATVGNWKGYAILGERDHFRYVKVTVDADGKIHQPDWEAGKFAAHWYAMRHTRQILNHLWESK